MTVPGREAAPVPEPIEEQVSRARSRIVALSGLDEGTLSAQVRLIEILGGGPYITFRDTARETSPYSMSAAFPTCFLP